ncbi:MAG: DNA double-strand break repair nuclease NurA [Candidatus Altiarchaeota archaeon]|nr:DNA double-strand break repair nuclease NurA [Candidatus Altiarchaeota archaeon]
MKPSHPTGKEMRHYSIWLERYGKGREELLENLKGHKREIDSIKKNIRGINAIRPLKKDAADINARMCFVDGGEGIKELLGAAVYFIKASGLVLDRSGGGIYEKFVRDLDMNILEYCDYLKERVEFLRSMMEFDVAEKCIEEHSPKYLFLDGSLYVNASKRPVDCPEYSLCRKKFARLLKRCRKEDIHVTGVSEDSRSRLFISHLSMKYGIKFPSFMTDSSVLRLLAGNTRYMTSAFTPQSRFGAQEELNGTLTVSFLTAYLQPTEVSNPLRIDVPDWEREFDRIMDLIVQLSKGSKQYGYPMPLYLAHLDARIEQKHADWSTTQLVHYLSKNDPELYDTILRERRHSFRP